MTTDDSIYRRLQIQLDRYPIGFPATASGVEIAILKYFFSPLEAGIALCLSLRSIRASTVRKRLRKEFGVVFSYQETAAALDADERRVLYDAIRETVSATVALGGRDSERDRYNQPGCYHRILDSTAVGQPCSVCGAAIEKIQFLGGSVYFCPRCQT